MIDKREEYHRTKKGVATVLCPPEEYHDLEARMVADFFTIAGFDTIYVGGNTPYHIEELLRKLIELLRLRMEGLIWT